jgi:hypothetical protein
MNGGIGSGIKRVKNLETKKINSVSHCPYRLNHRAIGINIDWLLEGNQYAFQSF